MEQGTLLNTISFPSLTDLIRKDFVMTQQMIVPQAKRLFITEPIGKGQGNTKRFDEIDTQTYGRSKPEGTPAKKASAGIGYSKTMTKRRFAMEIDITQEMRDENRYSQVGSLIKSLSWFLPQRIELDCTHRLTFITSTSYTDMDGETVTTTGGDGLAVASTVHTLKFSSVTWSNRLTGDPLFSRGAIEAAELLTTTDIKSNYGERRVMNFNAIITGDNPSTVNAVKQFLGSDSDVDQNNAGVMNVYKGKYKHIILPQLATTATGAPDATKKYWWFLAAVEQGTMGWQAYFGEWEAPHMKQTPTEGSNAEDTHTDTWTYGVRSGNGIVVVSGRGIIASCPTSS